jgi:hypothetical protein
MEQVIEAGGVLAYSKLQYRDLLALGELQKLGFADTRVKRRKLEVYPTEAGRERRADGYCTDKIILSVTGPQIDLLRHLADGPIDDSVGQPMNSLAGVIYDICRRMALRGWVEWYTGWDGQRWARLTNAGRDVIDAADALDETIVEFYRARRRRVIGVKPTVVMLVGEGHTDSLPHAEMQRRFRPSSCHGSVVAGGGAASGTGALICQAKANAW